MLTVFNLQYYKDYARFIHGFWLIPYTNPSYSSLTPRIKGLLKMNVLKKRNDKQFNNNQNYSSL
jgi:hypothetical protein